MLLLNDNATAFDPLAPHAGLHAGTKLLVVGEENVLRDPRQSERRRQPGDPCLGQGGLPSGRHSPGGSQLGQAAAATSSSTSCASSDWTSDLTSGSRNSTSRHCSAKQMERHLRRPGPRRPTGPLACWPISTPPARIPPPPTPAHPITTREALREYDPELYALVHETMAYGGQVDWRYQPARAE